MKLQKKKFNIDTSNLKRKLQEWGIHIKTRSELTTVPINKEEVIKFYETHSLSETCREFHKCNRDMKKLLLSWGVDFRSSSDAIKMSFENKTDDEKERIRTQRNIRKKQTCLEKYGVEWATQIPDYMEKRIKTSLEKYGVEDYHQTEECKEKTKNTCLKKYNSISPIGNKEVAEKSKNTMLNKYGCEFALQAQNFKNKDSKPNLEFLQLLNNYDIIIKDEDREFPLNNHRYDFKINNYLIEINPFATHNSTWGIFGNPPLDPNYHKNKSQSAKNNNYRCIHIWDWDNKDKIVSSLSFKQKIYARKCTIKEISKEETNKFLNNYHFQNKCNNQIIRLGLYYNNELIQIMTFGKPRYNKKYQWELLRLCTRSNYMVVGGAEKLFKYFVKNYRPTSIISYCDLSKFNGGVYLNLGFTHKENTVPTKHWYNPKTKRHITNNLLLQRGFDQLLGEQYGYYGKGTSNEELMLQHGFVEIYDCGQGVYEWKRENLN